MANDVKCFVRARYAGPVEDIKKASEDQLVDFLKSTKDGKTNPFTLNNIIPIPTDLLEEVPFDLNARNNEEYLAAKEAIRMRNYSKYGYNDWYDWRLAKWGTKWDTYDWIECEGTTWEFCTAWSAPIEAIRALSGMFPKFVFTLEYADEDLGYNCGTYTFEFGVVTDESLMGDFSKEAQEFAMEIWGYCMDEMEWNEEMGRYEDKY